MAGAMGLLHRKEAGESGQITKDFTCSVEAKGWGVLLSLRMTWPASNFRKESSEYLTYRIKALIAVLSKGDMLRNKRSGLFYFDNLKNKLIYSV